VDEATTRRRRRETRVIEKYTDLVADANEDHSVLLRFLYQAIAVYDNPVKRTVIEWYADVARPEDLDDGIAQNLFAEFLEMLGLRPRRAVLLSMLRDLVEMGYVSQSIEGFGTTPMGLGGEKQE
jgi:hypothetical protein